MITCINEPQHLRFQESRGVRQCRKCKVTMRPGVLTVALVRIIECKFSKTGIAGQREHYCLTCAEKVTEEAITFIREKAIRLKENKRLHISVSNLWKDIKEYKKILQKIKNWKHFFDQVIDHEVRKWKEYSYYHPYLLHSREQNTGDGSGQALSNRKNSLKG